MAAHNFRIYQIDEITFEKNPKNHVFSWKSYNKETNEY